MKFYSIAQITLETGLNRREVFSFVQRGLFKITYFGYLPRISAANYKKLINEINKGREVRKEKVQITGNYLNS